VKDEVPYFIIKNDAYIASYINSLSAIEEAPMEAVDKLTCCKV